jgi:glycosyltransferase involved in cell wall biosynthesis
MRRIGFTVVIPLYNKALYIHKAIQSVLLQTHKAKELIIIDDGSTDGGGQGLEELGNCIKVVRQQNAGGGAARNLGIALAKEEWVALLDADDFWDPEHLHELSRIIASHPEACLVATQFEQIKYGSTPKRRYHAPGLIRQIDFFAESSRRLGCVWSSSSAVKKSVLSEVGGFGLTKTGEDTEFWARVALHFPIAISEAQTAFYVRGVGGIVETLASKRDRNVSEYISAEDSLLNHPACKTVLESLSTQSYSVARKSLLLFLNAWRIIFMRQALVHGDFRHAAEIRDQLYGPMRSEWYLVVGLSYLPRSLVSCVLGFWRMIKSLLVTNA